MQRCIEFLECSSLEELNPSVIQPLPHPGVTPWSPGHAMQLMRNLYFQSFLSSCILFVKFHFEFKSLFSCAIYFRAYIETSFNITKTMLKIMNLTGQKNLFLHLTILTKRHSLPFLSPFLNLTQIFNCT